MLLGIQPVSMLIDAFLSPFYGETRAVNAMPCHEPPLLVAWDSVLLRLAKNNTSARIPPVATPLISRLATLPMTIVRTDLQANALQNGIILLEMAILSPLST